MTFKRRGLGGRDETKTIDDRAVASYYKFPF